MMKPLWKTTKIGERKIKLDLVLNLLFDVMNNEFQWSNKKIA